MFSAVGWKYYPAEGRLYAAEGRIKLKSRCQTMSKAIIRYILYRISPGSTSSMWLQLQHVSSQQSSLPSFSALSFITPQLRDAGLLANDAGRTNNIMIMRQIEVIILHLMMMTQQMPTILKLRRTHCWRMQPCCHHLRAVSMAPSTLQSKHIMHSAPASS